MQETATDWTLVSLSPLSGVGLWSCVALVLIGALVVMFSYRGARKAWPLVIVRFLGALLVLGFLLEPAVQLRVVRKIKNRLAVIVDRSRSMSLATESGQRRYDAVLSALEANVEAQKRLAEAHIVDWFDLEGAMPTASLKNPPEAEASDIVSALERARAAGGGKPLAGIVLFSDGADNADLEGETRGELSARALERLHALGVPVTTVAPGGSERFKDVSIADLRADEFAFVHNTFEVEVTIDAVGFENASLPVTLKRDDEVILSQTAVVGKDGSAKVLLKSKPDRIGEFVYTVSTPVLSGEAVTVNNERSFVLSVVRDKIRVLQVAGRPSWDERFLRQHLKENPNVDLISFFILRTPSDQVGAPESELSLIPFPVEKLFTTELPSFDVVIFQNFDYRPYKMAQYLPNIRDAVRKSGLGFVMIGGEQSFAGGGYAGTDLEDILALKVDTGSLMPGFVRPTLTDAGRAHPVTDLARGTGRNDQIWQRLFAFEGLNKTGGLAASATALVVDEKLRDAGGAPLPLVAVMDVGEGRSMAVATDSMWRWRFAPENDGGASERAYHRFWSNALRWLVRDPEHSRVRVTPEKRRFDVGEPANVGFSVLAQDYQPVAAAHLRVTLEKAGAGQLRLDDLTTGEGGALKQRYADLAPGAYHVRASASASGKQLGEGQGVFVVESRSVELARGAPRPDLLRALAKVTGGNALTTSDDVWENLELRDPEVVEVNRRRNIELWDNLWALVAGVILLAADWALRRRSGYL